MSNQYGGVYRLPPAPQRQRPSAILPAEVFPDPPVGSRGRQIIMAIVAAQWIAVPPPQQRRPTVTESAVEVFVPQSRVQDRIVIDSWQPVLIPQRNRPTAILPAEVFPDPPVETRRRSTVIELVAATWRPGPQPQPGRPTITESAVVEVFVPQSRVQDRLIVASWQTVPAPQRSQPTAILPAEVFPDPPVGQQRRQVVNVFIVEQWRYIPLPYQRPPTVTESGVAAVAVPPYSGGVAAPTLVYGGGVDEPALVFGGGVAEPTLVYGGGVAPPEPT